MRDELQGGNELQGASDSISPGAGSLATSAADFQGPLAAPTFSFGSEHIPLWKRPFDIVCATVAILTLLPVLAIIAALIKCCSKGPVIFRQQRVGLLGKEFTLYKFRSMIVGADPLAHEKHVASLIKSHVPLAKLDARGDTRLIPLGRMVRAAGLDELPQLINVLRGEMSIVGPRPCLPSEYNYCLPQQRERFRALPGITGLWQISGKNRTTFNEMIDYDIQYVRTQSLWLDLKIMLRTIPALLEEVKGSRSIATSAPPPTKEARLDT